MTRTHLRGWIVGFAASGAGLLSVMAGAATGADERAKLLLEGRHREGVVIFTAGTPGVTIARRALGEGLASSRALTTVYDALDAGLGFVPSLATTGLVGVEDYGTTLSSSGPPNGAPTTQFDTVSLSGFSFVGGADITNGILFFDFFFNDFAPSASVGFQVPSAGTFIWTITVSNPASVQIPTEGYVTMTANDDPGNGPVTNGQWFLSNVGANLLVGHNDTAWDNGSFDYGTPGAPNVQPIGHNFSLDVVEGEVFFGLEHTALGGATLSDDGGGNLIVSNIGSSGQDGVSIDPGDLEGFLEMALSSDSAGAGDQFVFTVGGEVDGTPDQTISVVTADLVSDGMGGVIVEVTPDFSPIGAATYSVWLANLGTGEIAQLPVAGLFGPAISFPQPARVKGSCSKKCRRGLVHPKRGPFGSAAIDDEERGLLTLQFDSAIAVQIGIEVPVLADLIVVTPEDTTVGNTLATSMRVTASGAAEFAIEDEALGPFRLFRHRTTGDARIEADSNQLNVSNIGSSGLDGVAIDLTETGSGGEHGAEFDLLPLDLGGAGRALTLEAQGIFAGSPSALGSVVLANNGAAVDVSADFGPIGSSNILIEVYDDGVLVGSEVVSGGGAIGTLASSGLGLPRIDECGKRRRFPVCFTFGLDRDGTFTPSGGPGIVGDQVLVLAADPSGAIDSLATFGIRGTDLGTFAITAETIPPPACVGDIDGDDDTDVFDFGIFAANFGQFVLPNSNGDLDGTGLVDVFDFGIFGPDFGCGAAAAQ